MGEKLGLQQLVDLVAERKELSRNDADLFVRSFFALIEKGLEQDKYVKIKGLGSFKLIRIESRESINVNTGERFLIEEHTKISFTPDPALRDSVNKPFSHFETVVLNDGVEFDDMTSPTSQEEVLPKPDSMEINSNVEEKQEEVIAVEEIPETSLEKPTTEAIAPEPEMLPTASEPVIIEKEEKQTIKKEKALAIVSPENEPITTPVPEKKKASYKHFWITFICFALVGGAAWIFFADPMEWRTAELGIAFIPVPDETIETEEITENSFVETEEEESDKEEEVNLGNVELVDELVQPQVEVPVTPVITTPTYSENARYTISGTKATHTVKPGERLTVISLHYYGTKRLWPYIAQYNPEAIKDPNVVPHGTVIKIPELKVTK